MQIGKPSVETYRRTSSWSTLPPLSLRRQSPSEYLSHSTPDAFLTPGVRRGSVYMTMHAVETYQLTDAVFDPHSRQPAYKACAVKVLPG